MGIGKGLGKNVGKGFIEGVIEKLRELLQQLLAEHKPNGRKDTVTQGPDIIHTETGDFIANGNDIVYTTPSSNENIKRKAHDILKGRR